MSNKSPKLVFTQPEFAAQSCELPEGTTTVGRSSRNTLVIRDGSVSADHCEILVSWNEVIVREHGSRNGTWVAGVPVGAGGQRPVNHGETVRFGKVEARLELPEPLAHDDTDDSIHHLWECAVQAELAKALGQSVVQSDAAFTTVGSEDDRTPSVSAPPARAAEKTNSLDEQTGCSAVPDRVRTKHRWVVVVLGIGAILTGVWWWWQART